MNKILKNKINTKYTFRSDTYKEFELNFDSLTGIVQKKLWKRINKKEPFGSKLKKFIILHRLKKKIQLNVLRKGR